MRPACGVQHLHVAAAADESNTEHVDVTCDVCFLRAVAAEQCSAVRHSGFAEVDER